VSTVNGWSAAHHAVVADILAAYPEVRAGRLFGLPAWFVGKTLFAYVYKEGVGIRLPAAAQVLIADPHVTPAPRPGRMPLIEWVSVNHPRSEDYYSERATFERAIRYAAQLTPGAAT